MKKLRLYVKMNMEEYTVDVTLNMTENIFYKEDEILECIHDMLRFYFGADPSILEKYIDADKKKMNKEKARQALKELYYYFYDLYLKDKINMYDWKDFKRWKWNIEDLTTFDN